MATLSFGAGHCSAIAATSIAVDSTANASNERVTCPTDADGTPPMPSRAEMARDDDAVLALLRDATAPLTLADLRRAGVRQPAGVVYRLQLDGHQISRTKLGLQLHERPQR